MTEATEEIIETTEEETIQKPKKRSEKQILALEQAREKRSEKARIVREEKQKEEQLKIKSEEKRLLREEILKEMKFVQPIEVKPEPKPIEVKPEPLPEPLPEQVISKKTTPEFVFINKRKWKRHL